MQLAKAATTYQTHGMRCMEAEQAAQPDGE
jgi:hypothetical protein